MELFYSTEIYPTHLFLSEEESRHCIRVLRKTTGETVQVIDGKGHLFEGTLEIEGKNKPTKVWIKSKTEFEASKFQSGFHLAIAPTKNADRMEWLVEKTVELGIASITFLQCEHSERSNLRLDRLEKIAISALKQSKQYWAPEITMQVPFKKYLETINAHKNSFIAHCVDTDKMEFGIKVLDNLLETFNLRVNVLIGPEGDFSKDEIALALQSGIKPVALGASRLRTETAGLYACAVYRSTVGTKI